MYQFAAEYKQRTQYIINRLKVGNLITHFHVKNGCVHPNNRLKLTLLRWLFYAQKSRLLLLLLMFSFSLTPPHPTNLIAAPKARPVHIQTLRCHERCVHSRNKC